MYFMKNNHFITIYQAFRRLRGLGRLIVAMAMAAPILPLGGCWGSAGGEGTVDIARAKGASYTNPNPDIAKAASARRKGVLGEAQKSRRK
jgi:hypothetical protein